LRGRVVGERSELEEASCGADAAVFAQHAQDEMRVVEPNKPCPRRTLGGFVAMG
jgi:hypothetical protein